MPSGECVVAFPVPSGQPGQCCLITVGAVIFLRRRLQGNRRHVTCSGQLPGQAGAAMSGSAGRPDALRYGDAGDEPRTRRAGDGSGPFRRRAIGSAGERLVHTEEVTGSIPVSPTRENISGPRLGGVRTTLKHSNARVHVQGGQQGPAGLPGAVHGDPGDAGLDDAAVQTPAGGMTAKSPAPYSISSPPSMTTFMRCTLGTTRRSPREAGWISMKDRTCASSYTRLARSRPETIPQKTQAGSPANNPMGSACGIGSSSAAALRARRDCY